MLIELKAHYLDLLVKAIEAGGNACLHHPIQADAGTIYVTRSETDTETEYIVQYVFDEKALGLRIEFRDGRPLLEYAADYRGGLGGFFPAFRHALTANRIEHKNPNLGKEAKLAVV